MSLRQRLDSDIKDALKAGEKARVGCLRMLKSKILEKEVALRAKRGVNYRLTDDEAIEVIAGYAKQRRDSIEGFKQGGRDDLVAREQAELEIVDTYLPARLSDDEIRRIAQEAIAEVGATSPREMGAVMKIVMPKLKGAADGKQVSEIVRALLG
jgi:uncharacterized protein YqeY